jgi:von Willebrand factor type A domain
MMSDRDYTLIIDKSGSMSTPDQAGGRNRWDIAQESTLALARKCEQFDPDGITVYVFSGRFKRYDDVTSAKVAQIFQENDPAGTTNLAGVLLDAFNNYFKRKAAGKTKTNGETILVGTDPQATKFLKALDEQLQSVGAKFDICDTVTLDDLEEMSLADVLMNAITD